MDEHGEERSSGCNRKGLKCRHQLQVATAFTMFATNQRLALAVAALLGLLACRGEVDDNFSPPAPPTHTVGGVVSGLSASGLALQLNDGGRLAVAADGAFVFETALQISASYVVVVAAQPSGQTCTIAGGSGTMGNANVTSVAVICTAALVPLFVDDFDRPDQRELGFTPDGQFWLISGPGYQSVAIKDGRYVGGPAELENNVSYAGIQMREQPVKLGGLISFLPSGTGGTDASVVALISSNDVGLALRHMIHLVASRHGVGLTWWQQDSQNNLPAACTGSTVFAAPLLDDGTSYPLHMTIRGDTVTVDKPDGTQFTCTDPHFSRLAGTLGIWELAYIRAGADVPRWDKAEAFVEAMAH
jgi:hypothetical protein